MRVAVKQNKNPVTIVITGFFLVAEDATYS